MYIRELLRKGQQKISRASGITTGVGKVADFILSAKEMVDLYYRVCHKLRRGIGSGSYAILRLWVDGPRRCDLGFLQ
jgi:histidine ammonia-lyase